MSSFISRSVGPRRVALCARTEIQRTDCRATQVHHQNKRLYSTPSDDAVLQTRSIPAPHGGSIRILTLNRPKSRNAISQSLLSALDHEIGQIHAEYAIDTTKTNINNDGSSSSSSDNEKNDSRPREPITRAVIITSSSTPFCAGADLKERLTFTPTQTSAFLSRLRSTFASIAALPVPSIAAVCGPAFGGGLELALCTHLRIFASTAVVGLPETRLGIIPGAGGTFRLPELIGVGRARDLILTGRRVGGAEAYFLGLCDRLVEVAGGDSAVPVDRGEGDGRLQEDEIRLLVEGRAIELARAICEGGPVALRAAIEALGSWSQGQEAENRAYAKVLSTEDRIEALNAFAEKRKPVYKGR